MPKYEAHECLLARQEEDVVKYFIDTGIFISMRRTFRSWCMISRSHPETVRYFKSYSACRNEEIRHLVRYYNKIHPFSMFNLYWEFFMFAVMTTHLILVPMDTSYQIIMDKRDIYYVKCVVDILQLFDIIKIFATGYYCQESSKVILDSNSLTKRYLKFYFFVDVISSLHTYVFILDSIKEVRENNNLRVTLRLLNRLKILRMARVMATLELFRRYMGYSSYLFKSIKVILIFIVATFWAFSVNIFVEKTLEKFKNTNLHNRIINSYYMTTMMLLLVNFGSGSLDEVLEYVKIILFIVFGVALQLFVYSQILQVWTKYASAENKHHSLHNQFKEYMKYKELPISLRERIFSYFQFKFHKQFFKESDINNMVSPLLKQEILLHVTKNHIEKVEFFKFLPETILMKLVVHLKSEIFLPGDTIISAGSVGTSMYFIYHGTVAVFTPSGTEICHLEDGAHFGEIALILSETRVATVIAVTASELFMLRRTDFLMAIEPFPEFKDHLIELATERLQRTQLASDKE